MLSNDISAKKQETNFSSINKKRSDIERGYDQEIQQLQKTRTATEKELVAELRGAIGKTGQEDGHGRHGPGPVSNSIKNIIQQIDTQIAEKHREKTKALSDFDLAAKDRDILASRYGVLLLGNELQTDQGVLSAMIQSGQRYQRGDLAIKAFLVLLFLSTVLLKLLAPNSVRIYFSERLQGLYLDYLQGGFNQWLGEQEFPSSPTGGMNPCRFDGWVANTYKYIIKEDQDRRKQMQAEHDKNRRKEQLEGNRRRKLEPLRKLACEIENEIEPRKNTLCLLSEEQSRIEDRAATHSSQILKAQADLALQQSDHDSLLTHVDNNGHGVSATFVVKRLESVQSAVAKTQSEIRRLESEQNSELNLLSALAARKVEIENELTEYASNLTKVRAAIQRALDDYMAGLAEL